MRIAYLCCDPGVPVAGANGSAVHVRETVSALRALGHEVRVLAAGAGEADATTRPLVLEGFAAEVARFVAAEDSLPPHLASELRRVLLAEQAQRTALPAVAAFEPHVLYERHSVFGFAGIELARDLRLPIVIELNAPLAGEAAAHRGLVLRESAASVEAEVLRRADAVVVVSAELERHARRIGVARERIVVLPNGVDPGRFHAGAPREHVRTALGLDGQPVVGFVGSLRRWHDLGSLVEACRLVRRRRAELRLLVVGDGPGAEPLAGVGDWVVRTGAVRYPDVPGLLAASDVVVVPYGCGAGYFSPLKLFEAMAAGRPVIGARIGQVADFVDDGMTGVLYEPSDVSALADRIEELLADPQRAAALGAAARRAVVASGRTWEANARRLDALFHRLVCERVAA